MIRGADDKEQAQSLHNECLKKAGTYEIADEHCSHCKTGSHMQKRKKNFKNPPTNLNPIFLSHRYSLVNMKSLLQKHGNQNVLDKACPDSESQHKLSNAARFRVTGTWENTMSWHKTLLEGRAKNRGS